MKNESFSIQKCPALIRALGNEIKHEENVPHNKLFKTAIVNCQDEKNPTN